MRIWSKEGIFESARSFSSVSAWRRAFPSAYANAFRNGFLKQVTSHMVRGKKPVKISNEEILRDAKKFSFRKDWIKNSRSKYFMALNRGIIEIATAHMTNKYAKKTKEQVMDAAKKYSSKIQWLNADPSSYQIAKKRGFFEEACSHMKRLGQTSVPEQLILSEIKKKFPMAKSAWFENKDKKSKFKRFQLDIYLPELQKGIEFNGTYWHSLEGLKRGRPAWTNEELLNYHNIKFTFFKNNGISIISVDQKEWEQNPQKTLTKVFSFLNDCRTF